MDSPPDDITTAAGWIHYWQYVISAAAGALTAVTGYIWRIGEQLRQTLKSIDRLEARVEYLEANRERTEIALASLPTREDLADMQGSINRRLEHITERLDNFIR